MLAAHLVASSSNVMQSAVFASGGNSVPQVAQTLKPKKSQSIDKKSTMV
jgi:hypothetical protein